MLTLVAAFAVLILALSLVGLFRPDRYVEFARWFEKGPGVWGAFAIRASLAVVLWLAADASRTPTAFRVLAVVTALGAVMLPFVGQRRFNRLIEWGTRQPPTLLRSLSALGVLLGAFLLWASVT